MVIIWLMMVNNNLVGGAITILKNDGVRQWEEWHPIYEMENKLHVPKHQTQLSNFYRFIAPISGLSFDVLWHHHPEKTRGSQDEPRPGHWPIGQAISAWKNGHRPSIGIFMVFWPWDLYGKMGQSIGNLRADSPTFDWHKKNTIRVSQFWQSPKYCIDG